MPQLNMETSHALGREEALRRLKEKISRVKDTYHSRVSDLYDEWREDTLSFAFKAVGMEFAGTVTVEASAVKLSTKLPFAAMMFKGVIEQRIREELGDLLA